MSDFDTSDHGFLKANIAPGFKRVQDGTVEGRFFKVVDKITPQTATFGAGCEVASGDPPNEGDEIGTTYGRFTKVVVNGTAYCYMMPE